MSGKQYSAYGVAPDRVYICTQLPAMPVSFYLAFPSVPKDPKISQSPHGTLGAIKTPVGYFCCTFPGVTSGGRYPLSCPAGPGLSSCQYLSAPWHATDRHTLRPLVYTKPSDLSRKIRNKKSEIRNIFREKVLSVFPHALHTHKKNVPLSTGETFFTPI